MAWMAGNLYVESSDQAPVVKALTDLLGGKAHSADPEGLLDAPSPLVVSPVHEGWVAVTGARGFFDELPWVGSELSRTCGARVLSCELIGNSYALRLATFEAGSRTGLRLTPEVGWTASAKELAEMPLYEDAERLALEELRAARVPLALCVIGTSPLSLPARPMRTLGDGVSLRRPEAEPRSSPVEVRAPELPGEDPPVLPTGTSQDFGLMLFEDRYVEGRPTLAAVDRLLAIEEEILQRARRACPDTKEVSLTVTYHAGAHQTLLDQELRARGRPTAEHLERGERVPWWAFWRYFGRLR